MFENRDYGDIALRITVEKLFMTFVETNAMNLSANQEAEALVIHDESDRPLW